MGKIDDAADIVSEAHADRDQRIRAADQKPLDQRLQEESVHQRFFLQAEICGARARIVFEHFARPLDRDLAAFENDAAPSIGERQR